MKKLLVSAALAATVVLSGCSTQTYVFQKDAEAEPTTNQRQHFFVSGLAQTKTLNAAAVCGGAENVAKVESMVSPLDGALSWLTFNIYTPRQAKVYCVSPMTAE